MNDAHITAMWLLFCKAPKKATPDVDGSFSLGEIGGAPEKQWTRLTPYSIARKEPHEFHVNSYALVPCR
jgi:hypothetical protein